MARSLYSDPLMRGGSSAKPSDLEQLLMGIQAGENLANQAVVNQEQPPVAAPPQALPPMQAQSLPFSVNKSEKKNLTRDTNQKSQAKTDYSKKSEGSTQITAEEIANIVRNQIENSTQQRSKDEEGSSVTSKEFDPRSLGLALNQIRKLPDIKELIASANQADANKNDLLAMQAERHTASLRPLMSLVDAWTGSKMAQGYEAPSSGMESIKLAAEDALSRRKLASDVISDYLKQSQTTTSIDKQLQNLEKLVAGKTISDITDRYIKRNEDQLKQGTETGTSTTDKTMEEQVKQAEQSKGTESGIKPVGVGGLTSQKDLERELRDYMKEVGDPARQIPMILRTLNTSLKSVGGIEGAASNPKADIPGIGPYDSKKPDFAIGTNASDIRANAMNLYRTKVYLDTGKQLNDSEARDQMKAQGLWWDSKDNTWARRMKELKDRTIELIAQKEAAYRPEVLGLYKNRGGKTSAEIKDFIESGLSPIKKDTSQMTRDEKLKYLEELKAMRGNK